MGQTPASPQQDDASERCIVMMQHTQQGVGRSPEEVVVRCVEVLDILQLRWGGVATGRSLLVGLECCNALVAAYL